MSQSFRDLPRAVSFLCLLGSVQHKMMARHGRASLEEGAEDTRESLVQVRASKPDTPNQEKKKIHPGFETEAIGCWLPTSLCCPIPGQG